MLSIKLTASTIARPKGNTSRYLSFIYFFNQSVKPTSTLFIDASNRFFKVLSANQQGFKKRPCITLRPKRQMKRPNYSYIKLLLSFINKRNISMLHTHHRWHWQITSYFAFIKLDSLLIFNRRRNDVIQPNSTIRPTRQ